MKKGRLSLLLQFLLSFTIAKAQLPLENGRWHADIQLNDSTNLPFVLIVDGQTVSIENAEERVKLDVINSSEDSLTVRFPLYDAEIKMASIGPIATGEYINHAKTSNNVFYFRCIKAPSYRCFMHLQPPAADMTGRWQLEFEHEEGVDKKNIALLKQKGNRVTGSVLTATGDHRYLDGELSGNHLRLSTFNGAFAFYYEGFLQNDGSLKGNFYSGKTGYDSWVAKRDEKASLPDPSTLTRMNPGQTKLDFAFPDSSGKIWTMNDPLFKNNVVVVQIMGTWCPNCLDESVFLNSYLKSHKGKGLEVIALDYERSTDMNKVWQNISRIKARLELNYPIVFGGNANRDSSSASLPMLGKIMAYPTSIIVDRKGNVRKIHTGFSGPATGTEFIAYQKEFDEFISMLLDEGY